MVRDNDEQKPEKVSEAGPHAGSLSPGAKASLSNGVAAASGQNAGGPPQIDSAVLEKIAGMRSKIHETFGKVALALAASPRQGGELRIHPLVSSLLDGETLRKMGVATGPTSGSVKT